MAYAVIIGQLHHGIVAEHIERSVQWYTGVLGLELVHRQRQENEYTPVLVGVPGAVLEVAQLKIPTTITTLSTHDIEIIQYVRAGGSSPERPVNHVGSAHLAFLVTDIHTLYDAVVAGGGRFRNPPAAITHGANAGGWGSYLHDPDGNTLEFIQPAPARLAQMIALLASGPA